MYSVKVQKQGFKAAQVKDVEVSVGRTASLKLQLEPGAVTQTVEVSASATTVDVTSTLRAPISATHFIPRSRTPRNVAGLFYVAPGVTDSGGAGQANPFDFRQLRP